MIADMVRRAAEKWASPRPAVHLGQQTAFPLVCSFQPGPAAGPPVEPAPKALAVLWKGFDSVRLFEDAQLGQWGLVLHGPAEAQALTSRFRQQRPRDHVKGDLVLGEFLGDSDLLLVRCDPDAADFGSVLVVLPLDTRADWYRVGDDLESFLEEYVRREGAKFWEGA